jgi:hypothetical protein
MLLHDGSLVYLCNQLNLWPLLRNGYVIDYGRRIPLRIQVVISSLEWTHSRPVLVQVSRKVLRVGSKSCIKFGNGDVSDLQFLPSLFFIRLEYFVE